MIDFKELPADGNAFEQLIREMLLIYDLRPQWSGKGSDQGRDIIATEKLTGLLENHERKWLVQCKHFAHSGKSVGREHVGDFIADCRQIGAEGYLLVCSTQPSSSLVMKLNETVAQTSNNMVTKIWDGVDIEKQLHGPRLFALGHVFFPLSYSSSPWRLYNRGNPSSWSANYKDYFLYLNSRIAGSHPGLKECEHIISLLESISPIKENEFIRPRAIFYDDKNGNFHVSADYLVPYKRKPSLKPSDFNVILKDGVAEHNLYDYGCPVILWDILIRKTDPFSDHYHKDHPEYYIYDDANFQSGFPRGGTVGELEKHGNSWRLSDLDFPPPREGHV